MVALFNYFTKITSWFLWAMVARSKFHYEDRTRQGRKIKGKAIVISNHTSVWDFGALMFLFPFRILRCVVAEIMYKKNPFMTFFLKGLGSVRVDRNNPDFAFIGKCKSILEKGGIVEIFPESRINATPDEGLLPFKPSVTYLALETGAPIIPVYTDGRYFTKERNHIVVGAPIDVRQLYDESRSEKENIAVITQYLRGKIHELRNQIPSEAEKNQGK